MVNGYSGFFPPGYLALKAQVQSFPDSNSLTALRTNGVSYCVTSRAFAESCGLENDELVRRKLEIVFRDELAGVQIFRLRD